MRSMKLLSLMLNLVAALIIVVWGLYKGIAAVSPGIGEALSAAFRAFFSNDAIPIPVRLAVPMLVVGIPLFLFSNRKPKAASEDEE